ncbi:redoxin domain-containing protein [Salinactinospora qingdaonensis]|uniref:Thioredoxin domain-containing protein n=1 Tax=Salinactinospora qingdaonensis TaxID=702744 RepID=A0ABP7GD96_9ACTN
MKITFRSIAAGAAIVVGLSACGSPDSSVSPDSAQESANSAQGSEGGASSDDNTGSAGGSGDSADSAGSASSGNASGSDDMPVDAPGASAPPPVLSFETQTVSGDDIAGASLHGDPAVLWFWAPWCSICRGEADSVSAAAQRYAGEVEFIGVAGRGEVDAMKGFVSDTGVDEMRHLVDSDGSIWSGFEVTSQPAFAFLRSDGSFTTVGGSLSDSELDSYIDEELS